MASLPKLEPSYFEDYNTYSSYPFQCLQDVWVDKYGKIWLKPCASDFSSRSTALYQFDGYSFISRKNLLKEVPNKVIFHALYKGEKLIGHTYIDSTLSIVELDCYTEQLKVIDTGVKNDPSPAALRVLQTKDNRFYIATRTEDGIQFGAYKDGAFAFTHTYEVPKERYLYFFHQDGGHLIINDFIDPLDIELIDVKTKKRQQVNIDRSLFEQFERVGNGLGYGSGNRLLFTKEAKIFDFKPEREEMEFKFSVNGSWQCKRSFRDEAGNFVYLFTDNENKIKAILEDTKGKLFDYSAFFKIWNSRKLTSFFLKSKDFKKEIFICNSQGFFYQRVESPTSIDQYLGSKSIRSMTELEDKKILVISQRREFFILDLVNETATAAKQFPGDIRMSNKGKFVPFGKGKIFGNVEDHFITYNYQNETIEIHDFSPGDITAYTFYKEEELIVLGTNYNLYWYDLKKQTARLLSDQLPNGFSRFIDQLYLDRKSDAIWIATTKGLIKVDVQSGKTEIVSEQLPFEDDLFLSFHVDDYERFWLGTSNGGLQIFDPSSGQLQQISSEKGLPNNTIAFILADEEGDRWVGTYNGLAVLDKGGTPLFNLNTGDGLSNREFNRLSHLKMKDGRLLTGTIRGVNVIDPIALKKSISQKGLRIYLTNLSKYSLDQSADKERIPVSKAAALVLAPSKRNLQISFALSNYYKPRLNQYSYRLKGIYDEWISIGAQHTLELTNLPAGNYMLEIKGRDVMGEWTAEPLQLPISAREYVYKQTWFQMLLVFLIVLAIVGISYFWIKNLRAQIKKATEKIRADKAIIEEQAEQLLEIDKAKSRFFTSISHEFRTPLTVILGMVDKLKAQPDRWLERGSTMIKRNSTNLLNLVNQILDLRKLESGSMQLNWVQGDIVAHLTYIFESFQSLAESKEIQLHLLCDEPAFTMDYDQDKILRILSNLLSNAIKFTPSGGHIYLIIQRSDASLFVRVKDSGIGIPENQIGRVFSQFYQVDATPLQTRRGSGIGLALSKELVQLMGGTIEVESKEGRGSTFTCILPIHQDAPLIEADEHTEADLLLMEQLASVPPPVTSERKEEALEADEKPQILLVEDNRDVMAYVAACLRDHYELTLALNGQEGIEKAIETIPDLVLSDVMMPLKNGFELCDTLKKDDRTSHIPIILLTAKADDTSKISGLSKGADDYLTKPFNETELLLRIHNLLEAKKKLQIYFQRIGPVAKTDKREETHQEDEFLQKVRMTLEANIDDEDFGIIQICQQIRMSRTQLHRKIKALTGQSTSHYLRRIRLNKAKELLEKTDLNVSEVGYEVGFRNPGYFSRSFVKEFGVSPNGTRK
ncbi:MAG: ATP-binding protein [Bacteroidota bacterium]